MISFNWELIGTIILFGGIISLRLISIPLRIIFSILLVFMIFAGFYSEYECDRSINNLLARWMKGIEICPKEGEIKTDDNLNSDELIDLGSNSKEFIDEKYPDQSIENNLVDAIKLIENKNYEESINLLAPLVKYGNAEAQFWLGTLFNNGQGVAVDHFRAYSLWRCASKNGSKKAATQLANFTSKYNPKDLARAEAFYQEQIKLNVIECE